MTIQDPVMEALAARFRKPNINYAEHIDAWATERLRANLWSAQREIAAAIVENRSTAVHACHGVGKSQLLAWVIAWWIDTHPPGQAFVVTTAPTAHQVASVLWRYVGEAHSAGKLGGRINRSPIPSWYIGEKMVGFGRKPADHGHSTFQGIHDKYILAVIDEAGGVDRALFDAIETFATGKYARVVAIGNPDDPSSYFATMCKPGSDWHTIRIDALRTPNMNKRLVHDSGLYPLLDRLMQLEGIPYSTEEIPIEVEEALVNPEWVEERLRRWCGFNKTSHLTQPQDVLDQQLLKRTASQPLWVAKVRGLFPTDASANKVVPMGWAQAAMDRWRDWDDAGRAEQAGRRVLGVDVARSGEDDTIIAHRHGDVVIGYDRYSKADTMETANNVAVHMHFPRVLAVIDVNGIGAGVLDRLREMKNDDLIEGESIAFNASFNSKNSDAIGEFKFLNDRAASWWRLRELLDPSRGSTLMLPPDEALLEEIAIVEYKVRNGGVIQIESKDEIFKKIGRSTDVADAVINSLWVDGVSIQSTMLGPSHTAWGQSRGATEPVVSYVGYEHYEDDLVSAGGGMDWDV